MTILIVVKVINGVLDNMVELNVFQTDKQWVKIQSPKFFVSLSFGNCFEGIWVHLLIFS